jgi:hypothetical protein
VAQIPQRPSGIERYAHEDVEDAERFCAAGYACLVFDYRHYCDNDGQPRQLLDIGRQLDEWAAATGGTLTPELLDLMMQQFALARGR